MALPNGMERTPNKRPVKVGNNRWSEAAAELIAFPQLRGGLTPQPGELLGEFGTKWRQSVELFAKDENAWREFGQSMREFFDQATQAGDVETARLAGQVYQLAARQRAALAQGNPLSFTDEEQQLLKRFARHTDEGWYLMDEIPTTPEAPQAAPSAPTLSETAKRRGFLDDLSERVGLDKRSLLELLMILLMMNRR